MFHHGNIYQGFCSPKETIVSGVLVCALSFHCHRVGVIFNYQKTKQLEFVMVYMMHRQVEGSIDTAIRDSIILILTGNIIVE